MQFLSILNKLYSSFTEKGPKSTKALIARSPSIINVKVIDYNKTKRFPI